MSSLKTVASNIDWAALGSKLKPETLAALNVFRRRHADLSKTLADLKEQDVAIDFAHYRSVLKNQKVVNNAESSLKTFKAVNYDLEGQLKLIQQHEAKAVTLFF
jgi:F-type H+-transporting ATPase subunit d